jgi:hypothetical protein
MNRSWIAWLLVAVERFANDPSNGIALISNNYAKVTSVPGVQLGGM